MYYRGDYYRGDYYRGDPSIFGTIGKALGGAVKGVVRGLPVIGGAIGGAIDALSTPAPVLQQMPFGPTLPGGGGVPRLPAGGGGGVPARISPLGTVGVCPTDIVYTRSGQARKYRLKKGGGCTWHKRPTMNPMNPRAAGRAITRIKAARHLLQRIERGLPHRAAKSKGKRCGCK